MNSKSKNSSFCNKIKSLPCQTPLCKFCLRRRLCRADMAAPGLACPSVVTEDRPPANQKPEQRLWTNERPGYSRPPLMMAGSELWVPVPTQSSQLYQLFRTRLRSLQKLCKP